MKPITTVESLRKHLQWALELEHSTIPPYLCALYSIPDGSNVTAATLIRSVVMEEMLHMVLAANLLNAVGGEPAVDQPKFVPEYPTYLPHSDDAFKVDLLPFSTKAIDTFLKIERPARAGAKPQSDHYHTIGQFYLAILEAFEHLASTKSGAKSLFSGKKSRQVTGASWYYGGGGEVIEVTDLESARHAIREIAEQGEGLDHTIFDGDDQFGQIDELAHYFRFNEIRLGRRYSETDTPKSGPSGSQLLVDWSTSYPMAPNPKAKQYVHQPEIHQLMTEFNERYTALLHALHAAFNGKPEALKDAVPLMYDLRYRAQTLMKIPSGRDDGTTVGPSFEFVGK
jgi:hypothetical protein